MKWLTRWVWVVLAALLIAGVAVQFRAPAVEVEVAEAQQAPLRSVVEEDGKTRVRERYVVSAPIAGSLARIELHAGDPVEAGSVVARLLPTRSPLLDPRSAEAASRRVSAAGDGVRQAQATEARAQAAADLARTELQRATSLAARQAATAQQLDNARAQMLVAESDLESARFGVRVAQHELEGARAALGALTGKSTDQPLELRSPIKGRVLRVMQESEGVVPPGAPLLEIGDPTRLEVVADVLSTDAVQIHPGMRAELDHWGGPATLAARVRRVEPSAFTRVSALGVEEQRVNVVLDLDAPFASWSELGDGFAVEVRVILWEQDGVLQVPTSAVFRDARGWAVFAVDGNRVRVRQVTPGHRAPLQTEISGGLSPGERVVIHPGTTLQDGQRVASR